MDRYVTTDPIENRNQNSHKIPDELEAFLRFNEINIDTNENVSNLMKGV